MRLFVVRHAHAGSRSGWEGDDRLRPLSEKGERQARAVSEMLVGAGVTRFLSSPYIRCIATFEPAIVGATNVDSDDRLAEGAGHEAAWLLLDEVLSAQESTAICSHGDVVPTVLRGLAGDGVRFHDGLTWPKASIWIVTAVDGRWSEAAYVPPPSV